MGPLKIFLTLPVFILFFGTFFVADSAFAANAEIAGINCIGCHATDDVIPGLYKQYARSAHFKNGVTCFDCHGAKGGEEDAFKHEGAFISIVVSPEDCKKCHEKAVREFNASGHAKALKLVTTGCGDYVLKNLAGSQYLYLNSKYAAYYAEGINGCWRCHGSEIKIDKKGRPTPETWPNSGIGRKNPDGSFGNCAACHERHEFSVAQARRPESCGVCHNSAGRDPQLEIYNTSRHGITYYAKIDQMNLNSKEWVVGRDYFAAPTCATCHMSATKDMANTHNINERLDWSASLQRTNALAITEKCGCDIQEIPYEQPKPDGKHKENMKKVCNACHSGTFTDNFLSQYQMEIQLISEKWLGPGKELFKLATGVLKAVKASQKENYELFTNPIDFTWFSMCNTLAKTARTGAAMMSPGYASKGNVDFAATWYSSYIPQIEGILDLYKDSTDKDVSVQVKELRKYFNEEIKSNIVFFGPWKDKKPKRVE